MTSPPRFLVPAALALAAVAAGIGIAYANGAFSDGGSGCSRNSSWTSSSVVQDGHAAHYEVSTCADHVQVDVDTGLTPWSLWRRTH